MYIQTLQAPAKVNLFLEVTGKRPNGYHELTTLFAKVSLADTLHVRVRAAGQTQLQLHITGPWAHILQADEHNLVLRAARLFEKHFGITFDLAVELDKQIPMGAGLGGGSSDAGTLLRALCQAFDKNPLDLLAPAARLGADVPLFLYPDTFLRGEGIGEILTPLPAAGVLPWAVLVYPDTAVPTPQVFGRLVLPSSAEILTNLTKLDKIEMCLRQAMPVAQWQAYLFNRLETAVLPYVLAVRKVKEDFSAMGNSPLMSGSGSTVFALFSDKKQADKAAAKINQQGRRVFVVRFVGREDEDN